MPTVTGQLHPPGLWVPFSACGVTDSVDAGLPGPPPSVLSVSHALDGLHPATPVRACFIPVTLLGFRLQGFDPRRGSTPLSRRLALVSFTSGSQAAKPVTDRATSERCSPRESAPRQAETRARPLPSWRSSLQGSPGYQGGSGFPLPPPMHFAARGKPREGCFGVSTTGRLGISSSRRCRPSWASSPRPAATLASRSRFR